MKVCENMCNEHMLYKKIGEKAFRVKIDIMSFDESNRTSLQDYSLTTSQCFICFIGCTNSYFYLNYHSV